MTAITESGISTLRRVLDPLADEPLFLAWVPGQINPETGKFGKHPVRPDGRWLLAWQDKANHITLDEAIDRARRHQHLGAGVGIAFHPEAVATDCDGIPLFITALDIDNVVRDGVVSGGWMSALRAINSYAEISPSGNGVRVLALTTRPFKTQRTKRVDGDHVPVSLEIFGSSGFVTSTGNAVHDVSIRVCTKAIEACHELWFGALQPHIATRPLGSRQRKSLTMGGRDFGVMAETPANVEQARKWLDSIGYVNDRDRWRDVIWAVMNLRWDCSESIAREWASNHCGGFVACWEAGFDNVVNSFCEGQAKGWTFLRDAAGETARANLGRDSK